MSKKGLEHLLEGYADDLSIFLRFLGYKQDKMQLEDILRILKNFEKVSGLAVNLKKINLVPFGNTLAPDILALKDVTRIDTTENFKLLGIDFNNKLESEDIGEAGKTTIKGMNSNYKQQMEKMRK